MPTLNTTETPSQAFGAATASGSGGWRSPLHSLRLLALGEPGDRPWTNVFLVSVPIALAAWQVEWPPIAVFILSLASMVPLAERLGYCTESLADHFGDTIGGLLNASMGNLPELIISVVALKAGKLEVVRTSLIGSILSNLLLVLGSSFLLGGIKHESQEFNIHLTTVSGTLLILGATCVLLPTLLVATNNEGVTGESALLLSRVLSLLMLASYAAYMLFQLCTHAHLFDGDDSDAGDNDGPRADVFRSPVSLVTVEAAAPAVPKSALKQQRSAVVRSASAMVDVELAPAPAVDLSSSQGDAAASTGPAPTRSRGLTRDKSVAFDANALPHRTHRSGSTAMPLGRERSVVLSIAPSNASRVSRVSRHHVVRAAMREERFVGVVTGASEDVTGDKAGDADVASNQSDGDDDEPPLNRIEALVWLAIVSGLIAVLSEALVDSIDEAAQKLNIPLAFVSTILLPIAGNAAEHASALIFAMRNRLDVSIGVAVGSATQISLFVLPMVVVIGWGINQPLSLDVTPFDAIVWLLTVLLVVQVVGTVNRTTWLPGLLLVGAYVAVAVTCVDSRVAHPDRCSARRCVVCGLPCL